MTDSTLKCDNCVRRNRWLLRYPSTGRHICGPCAGTEDAHEREFPDCPEKWHDGYDHDAVMVRRADAWDITAHEYTQAAAAADERN